MNYYYKQNKSIQSICYQQKYSTFWTNQQYINTHIFKFHFLYIIFKFIHCLTISDKQVSRLVNINYNISNQNILSSNLDQNIYIIKIQYLLIYNYLKTKKQSTKMKSNDQHSFPITTSSINKEQWHRKTSNTLMMSFQSEQQTLPILQEISSLLQRLKLLEMNQTFEGNDIIEFFFTNVFPVVCQKLINSKYFRNEKVLALSNNIMESCIDLYNKYTNLLELYPKWAELLVIIFDPSVQYFRSNDQIENKNYPWHYYITATSTNNLNAQKFQQGEQIDAIKIDNTIKKATWSRGKIISTGFHSIVVEFLNDAKQTTRQFSISSLEIAEYKTKSLDFEWRMSLKEGDTIDCCDTYGLWYISTVLSVTLDKNKKLIKVGYRLYDKNGQKQDIRGKYYGLSQSYDEENIDVTSPRVQIRQSIAKQKQYSMNKHQSDYVNDFNDNQFKQVNGEEITFVPRSKYLSGFLFRVVRTFIKEEGYQKLFKKLQQKSNVNILVPLVSSLGNLAPNLHKAYIKKLINRLKPIIHQHLYDESQITIKAFTKQKSDFVFTAMKHLIKRISTLEQFKQYENSQKLGLGLICLNSDTLKRRLQGIGELKDILRTYRIHLNNKIEDLSQWLKVNKIFEKIYVVNSHVQLIKRSTQFFRFLINQNILGLQQLALIYKSAQKGDYETKISIYKLFSQVSHNFNKIHADFLLDQILESELSLISSEDIDLLHELSRYSNYFPVQKVMAYFQKIVFSESTNNQLLEASIKKYTEIFNKNYDMKHHRRDVLLKLIEKMGISNVEVIIKILTNIFQNVTSGGEWGKYQLLQILQDNSIDIVILNTVKKYKQNKSTSVYLSATEKLLTFINFILGLSARVHISMETFIEFWNQMIQNGKTIQQKQLYYKWCNQICKGDHLSQSRANKPKIDAFFLMLTNNKELNSLNQKGFQIIKHLFLDINKKDYKLSITNAWKMNKQVKIYKLKTWIKNLKFYDILIEIIYKINDYHLAELSLKLFNMLYSSQQILSENRISYFHEILEDFFKFISQKDFEKVVRNIKLLEFIIDESEKQGSGNLKSLLTIRKGEQLTLQILNETTYTSDNLRKFELKIFSNSTLLELRKKLGQQLAIHWRQIRISQKQQLTQLLNSKTIKNLKIKLNQSLVVTKKSSYLTSDESLIIANKLNPKAEKALKNIFKRYSTDGKMNKEQCRQFIGLCVGDLHKQYEEKLQSLFKKYDKEKKNYLIIQNIIDFYQESAKQKPSIVWTNLRNCGISNDFKCYDDPDEQINQQLLPRYLLSKNNNFYEALFNLLNEQQRVAKSTWQLLQLLPISHSLYNEVIKLKDKKKQDEQWQMLDISSPYKTIYILYVFQYLTDSDQDKLLPNQKLWKQNFIKAGGYQYLFEMFKQIIRKQNLKSIQINIMEFILKMITKYLIYCFIKPNISQSYTILQSQLQFEELINYLKTYECPKNCKDQNKIKEYTKLVNPDSLDTLYQWKGESTSLIISNILNLITKLWNESKNQIQRNSQIQNCFQILLVLLFDDCSSLVKILNFFLEKQISVNIKQKLYKLLIGLCYSQNNRDLVIDFLIMQLKKSKILSKEYFKTLALLVFKHGLSVKNQNVPEMLLSTVLNSENELVIEGCLNILMETKIKYQELNSDLIEKLWKRCAFSKNITCKSESARQSIYGFLIKLAANRTKFSYSLVKLTIQTLNTAISKTKIVSTSQILNRSIYNYAGIKNIGNVCYMLAMIQQFYLNTTFRNLILRIDDKIEPNIKIHNGRQIDDNLLHQFQKMFAYLSKTQRMDFIPTDFCFSFKDFSGEPVNITIQQDAQEFISMIFDKLENAIKHTPFKHILDNIYGGKVSNLFTCGKCNQVKIREQNFYSLSVQVKNSKTLNESFNKLIQGEIINDFKCDFCNQKADVTKKTAISKPPNFLIIHLQRLVFNFDTFLNEKINSKLEFPLEFNLQPYTLSSLQNQESTENYQYTLKGVVVHYGTAQFGHYYSFIKNLQNQWLQFNDSRVSQFDIKNIQAECYGGQSDSTIIQDEFQMGKKQNSKNAYILIYEKTIKGSIQLEFISTDEKQKYLSELNLIEIAKKSEQIINSDTLYEDEQMPQAEQNQMYRKLSKQYKEVELQKPPLQGQFINQNSRPNQQIIQITTDNNLLSRNQNKQIRVELCQLISEYIPEYLKQEINEDNLLHQFQVNICSASFLKFYNDLLKIEIPKELYPDIINLTQKLIFGIWIKNPFLKQIFMSFQIAVRNNPQASLSILKNQSIFILLLQSSDTDLRTSISNLLASCIGSLIQIYKLTLTKESELDCIVTDYLDNFFKQLPTTVAKNWMKFSQYFEFWKNFAQQGQVQFNYLMRKQTITHFIDYFLQKKSPLQIYANKKYSFGNKYTQANFISLFATISHLVNQVVKTNLSIMSKNDKLMLLDYNFLDKLIVQNNQIFVNKIILATARNSLSCSFKIAIVILKGFYKSTYQSVQPFLQVMNTFLLIQDDYQQYRIKWILGHPTLAISTITKSLTAFNSYTTQERLYLYQSTIQYDLSISLLQSLYKMNNRAQNFCCLCLKALLILCNENKAIFQYIYNLPPPCLNQAKYYDFVKDYLEMYIDQSKRYKYPGFPRQQLGRITSDLFNKFLEKVNQRQKKIYQVQNLEKKQEFIEENKIQEIEQNDNNIIKQEEVNIEQKLPQILDFNQQPNQENAAQPTQEDMELIKKILSQQQGNGDPVFTDADMLQQLQILKKYQEQKNQRQSPSNVNPSETLLNVEVDQVGAWEDKPNHHSNQNSYSNTPIKSGFKNSQDTDTPLKGLNSATKNEQDQNLPQTLISNQFQSEPVINVTSAQQALNDKNFNYQEQKMEVIEQELPNQIPQLVQVLQIEHPCSFKYNLVSTQVVKGLILNYHQSQVTYIKTRPDGKKNNTFLGIYQKLYLRIPQQLLNNARREIVCGYYILNSTREYMRIQWKFGTMCIKPSQSTFVWAKKIDKIWITDRQIQWPKWSLYDQK